MNYFELPAVSNSDLTSIKLLLYPKDLTDYTEAYRFGTLLDNMITEPYRIDYYKRTCDGEKYFKPDFTVAEAMKKAFYQDEYCMNILRAKPDFQYIKTKEMTFNFCGFEFTLLCKCKWDFWLRRYIFGGDIKSTMATSQKGFEKACDYFDYDRQRAWYMDTSDSNEDVIIGISKVAPHKIFKVFVNRDSEIYKSGKDKYKYLAFKYYLLK